MNTNDNQRAQRTRKRIKEVFLIKITKKPIRKITVQEICKEAKVNRTTFYTHYDNINDLMKEIEVEMQQGINKLFMDSDLGVYKPFTDRSLEQLITYIHERAIFYRILLNNLNSLNIIDQDLSAAWGKEIEPILRKNANSTEAELHYRFEYFNSGLRGIVRRWLNSGCPESPERLVQIIRGVVRLDTM
ncbi:MAG: TetR/AcrR family transcriptional regulator C-terminal domain-containing protein [Anaerolineales bacterium]